MAGNNCGRCYGDIKRGEKVLPCSGWCEKLYHTKCVDISNDEFSYISSKKYIGWFCECCLEKKSNYMRNLLEEMKEVLQKVSTEMVQQNGKIENLGTLLKTNNDDLQITLKQKIEKQDPMETSYASKLNIGKQDPVVLIKPKNQDQKSIETKNEIKKSIDPTDLEFSGLRHVSKGGIIIECKNKEAVSKLQDKAKTKLGDDYEISIPKKKSPRVKIVGLSEKLSFEVIEEKIKSQNSYLEMEDALIKVVHIKEGKGRRKFYTVFAEVNAKAYGRMMNEEKVNINWDRCKIYDATEVTRCFSCSGFNHKASQCRSDKACPKCAGPHLLNECKANDNELKCINCTHAVEKLKMTLDTKHAAWSTDCAVFKRKLEIARSKTNFLV